MRTFSSLFLLGALGVLSAAATSALAAPDLSKWKCETCPFEKTGVSGVVEGGVGYVSDDSARFGDFTGLDRKGGYLALDGELRVRRDSGFFGNLAGSTTYGTLAGDLGMPGLYTLRLGYAEIPRHQSDQSRTPFTGVGSDTLTLPAGFTTADTTSAMPLATTLQPVELGTKRQRVDLGLAVGTGTEWTHRLSVRRDVRDGLQRTAGSFFSTTSQLPSPVDQVTDQFEVSTHYAGRNLHGSLAYQVSQFDNALQSLTWANPFTPVVAGANRGQLALAPDNEFHQIVGSAGYAITPTIRASADFAVGRLTQDEPYLASSLSSGLGTVLDPAASLAVPTLPQASLQGKVETFSGNARVTATPMAGLRVSASYSRDVRENLTPQATYASVVTDMFLGSTSATNRPYGFTQDRYRLNADYRWSGALRLSAGVDRNDSQRSYQEAVNTHETTVWGRVNATPVENLSLSLKLQHGKRDNDGYGVLGWLSPPENERLRKFYLADRTRDSARLRADYAVTEAVSVGVNADYANDDYTNSPVGLTGARSTGFGADLAAALTDELKVRAFAQADRIRSNQLGSQAFAGADWSASSHDRTDVVGIGASYTMDKLQLGADVTSTRTRSDVTIDTGGAVPAFPTATTSFDSVKLTASYKLMDNLTLVGNLWHERYASQDWRADGILPDTVANLLALGEPSPRYRVNVVRLGVRYRF